MPCYAIDGVIPIIHPSTYVHPSAVLIGDVVIGPRCYIGPHASLRGDFGTIELKIGSNVQDGCILHCFPGQILLIEENGHIGHGAVLHGCTIHRNALVGMKSVIMDGANVGEHAIVAASALIPSNMQVPPCTLVAGLPAKIVRLLEDQEMAWKNEGTLSYHLLTERSLKTMVEVNPLTEREISRPTLNTLQSIQPLSQTKIKKQ